MVLLNTIHIDTREKERPHPFDASKTSGVDMLKLFKSHPSNPICIADTLDAGDFCFVGEGPEGPTMVGVERKRLRDMMNSIRSGRFSGEQLPKLLDKYGQFAYLVIEGSSQFRTNFNSGILEEKRGRDWVPWVQGRQSFLGLELDSFLNDIHACTPVKVRFTRDAQDTVGYILSLAHSFAKPWDQRHHHVAIHTPMKYAMIGKASTVRRVAYALEGVGWEKSGVIQDHFGSVEAMVKANPSEWARLPGFGKVLSEKVWNQLHGGLKR